MVRRRVEIKPIEENSKRYTTFTKRRNGLFKKTGHLCGLCGAEAAVIVFSKAGNVFGYGNPTVHTVVGRYLADPNSILARGGDAAANGGAGERVRGGGGGIETEELTQVENRIVEAMENGRPAWDAAVRNLGLRELDELEATMEEIKSRVAAARARELGGENLILGCGCLNPGS